MQGIPEEKFNYNVYKSTDQGHKSLVNWWSTKTPLLTETALEESLKISNIIDDKWLSNEYTCGFEFHHYQPSKHPDFLVYGETSSLSNCSRLDLPQWWTSYEDSIANLRREILHDDSINFSVPSENWLEFDMNDDKLILVGIWQAVKSNKPCNLDDWIRLSNTLACSFLSRDKLHQSSQIRNFVRSLSLPTQIGLMHKRSKNIKFMIQFTTHQELIRLENYLDTFDNILLPDFNRIVSALKDIGPILRPAISIDIDLADDSINPVVAIEIHQKKQIGRQLLPETRYFINDICKLEQSQQSHLDYTLKYLPSSIQQTYTDLTGVRHLQTRIARLNHLKITINESNKQLKSYVRLVEQNSLLTI